MTINRLLVIVVPTLCRFICIAKYMHYVSLQMY